jgi:hemerythrin-like domain-containing protein
MCSYCGCRSISVIGELTEEHEQIINAAAELRRAALVGDAAAAGEHARDVARLLHPHTAREERGLFRELRLDPEFTDHIDSLTDEHDEIDIRLEEILAGELARVTELVDLLRAHIDREEDGLFPAAAIALFGPAWERVVEHAAAEPA